ncbi:Flagellar motor protein [hydrothermal vent metagenome]|uniref:Flagellar motor protein n=1 Tax=hydrothermal vent metagenome TaxID=652676 RepID=A0A1W1CEH2_9ZZZZ
MNDKQFNANATYKTGENGDVNLKTSYTQNKGSKALNNINLNTRQKLGKYSNIELGIDFAKGTNSKNGQYLSFNRDKDNNNSNIKLINSESNLGVEIGHKHTFSDNISAYFKLGQKITSDKDDKEVKRRLFNSGITFIKPNSEGYLDNFEVDVELGYRTDKAIGDNDVDSRDQYLFTIGTKGSYSDEVKVFSNLEISKVNNKTQDKIEKRNNELEIGFAYRPIDSDFVNIISKVNYFDRINDVAYVDTLTNIEKEKGFVLSEEAIIDIDKNWQISEKLAYRLSEENILDLPTAKSSYWLLAGKLGYKINENSRVWLELRHLRSSTAKDAKQGVVLGYSQRINKSIELAVGYNFTEFDDNLTYLDYSMRGIFVRVSGIFGEDNF